MIQIAFCDAGKFKTMNFCDHVAHGVVLGIVFGNQCLVFMANGWVDLANVCIHQAFSRLTLIPTSMGLLAIAFFPGVVAFAWNVPAVVVGTILLYIMCAQLAAGLMVACGRRGFSFQDGMVIGIPMMVSILVSYLPVPVRDAFPPLLMPLLGTDLSWGWWPY